MFWTLCGDFATVGLEVVTTGYLWGTPRTYEYMETPMSAQKLIAFALVFSFFLSGCDLVTETQWIVQSGW